MKKVLIIKSASSILFPFIESATQKILIEVKKLKPFYPKLNMIKLRNLAINNLKKTNSDVETLNDFIEINKSLKTNTDIPFHLQSKEPILTKNYNINGISTTVNHCHIHIERHLFSLLWLISPISGKVLIMLIDKHPKNNRGYSMLIKKLPSNVTQDMFVDMSDNTKNKQRKTLLLNGKKLTLKIFSDSKNIEIYRGNNQFYILIKIKENYYIYTELSRKDRIELGLINPKNLSTTELKIQRKSLSDIIEFHLDTGDLYLLINGKSFKYDLSNSNYDYPSERDMILHIAKNSDRYLESLRIDYMEGWI